MLSLTTKTKLSPEEAIKLALAFFGPGGCGLEVKELAPSCVYLEGGGGHIDVVACAEGKGSSLDLTSQEWDHQVQEFARKVPR